MHLEQPPTAQPRPARYNRAMNYRLALFCLAVASLPRAAAAAPAPIDLSAFRALIMPSAPQIAPDGRSVAFIRSSRDYSADKNRRALMLVSTAGGAPRALTSGHNASSPRWSPGGHRLAYLSRGAHSRRQVFVYDLRSAASRALTAAPRGVEQFAWSPHGKRILFVTENAAPNAAAAARHDNLFSIHDDGFLTDGPPAASHLWVVPSHGGTAHRLTNGSWSVLEAPPPFAGAPSDPSWSSDGREIAFTRQIDADDSDTDKTRIALAPARGGHVQMLTAHTTYEYEPLFAPHGDDVAYLYPHGPGPISVMDIHIADAATGHDADVTQHLNRDIFSFSWMPGGRHLIALANDRAGIGMWEIAARTGAAHRIALGKLAPSQFSISRSGSIAFVASTATTPPEVYLLPTPSSQPKRLTDLNASFARYAFGRSKEMTWTAPDGQRNDGIVTYPVGYVAGRKYPLVLYIHGGPEAASSLEFLGIEIGELRHALAGSGYMVFEPNYRGSDNLGNAHEHAIYRDPGVGPASDVMSGLRALERTGAVDTSRIAIVGHSYGGYMTTWLIAHQHIWRCAVVADGMVDWAQEYNLSADGNLAWARDSLGGTPSDPHSAALYRTGSPITYAGDITTPTLIFSGTADQTVPITESYTLYHTLADHHVPVRFIGIPGAHHFPSDPVRIERYYAMIMQWVGAHMPHR